jgi:flagellar protein FliO/FliZ
MTFFSVLQMVFALAVTLGLFGLIVVALRRYGPGWVKKLQATQGSRRLKVIESLMLDQSRRLVLVDVDGEERLILVGDARFAGAAEEPRRPPSPARTRKAKS